LQSGKNGLYLKGTSSRHGDADKTKIKGDKSNDGLF
jgi:hypothetical protein